MQRPAANPATPLAASKPSIGPAATWDDLAAVLDQLAVLAAEQRGDEAFYREFLRLCVVALSAEGGAVWTADANGALRRACLIDDGHGKPNADQRQAHENLLRRVLSEQTSHIEAASHDGASPEGVADETGGSVRLVSPIVSDPNLPPTALLEVSARRGARPGAYDAALKFLETACEIAGQRGLRTELRRLRDDRQEHQRLVDLGRRVHGDLDLERTCMRIANETRDAVGCDRVSVLVAGDSAPRLMAVSGADHVDRRTQTARGMQALAELVVRLEEPVYLVDGESPDADDAAADAVQRFADLSHARQLVAMPLSTPNQTAGSNAPIDSAGPPAPVGVLVVEHFDATAGDFAKDRLAAAAEICGPALANAVELDRLPLLGVSRALRSAALPKTRRCLMTAIAAVAIPVACLTFIETDFRIESPGELRPVVQQHVFAPRSSLVTSVLATHGQRVEAGQTLLELRDPELDLAIKQVEGELATTRRQLDAVQATRTRRDAREPSPTDAYRLSAEQQLLRQRVQSLDARHALLQKERASLSVVSPAAGVVVSWRVEQSLVGRPVERGQSLLTVADTTADWRIELRTPDDRIGHVIAASEASDTPLRVEYRLASEEGGLATGAVTDIAQRAEATHQDEPPSVRVVVTPDDPRNPASDPQGLRPGLSVRARIDCGRRSLGYVWLHDLWHTAKTWWEF